ncbi:MULTISPECIES: hypothetical protein [unclassified Caballeronia]|uniref:hypothetical protein n=1 Tax=unclassified Caballeronia TaxID=2646786 RepID=UPI00285B91A5|nr:MULTISPECIES: hypothetical protein [unclassified Caballeronia]MDR5772146.1 hypothetical protein [Caballeronia sp. LZ002]MDR5804421.1 hypothetical protein [Caballeronia sp. LZ001]MDR5847580.1 hypothetical protein [Caballeronia sp. LZ003]
MRNAVHPLEHNTAEAEYLARQSSNGAAAYRRAVEATTGHLPTWAKRSRAGRKKRFNEDAALEAGALDL